MELSFRILGYLTLLCYLLHHTNAVTPVFQDSTPPTITEGLPPGTFYYKFVATDATPGHVVTYSLDSKASEWFNINSTTGEATVKKTIDREEMGSAFRYKVFASDGTKKGEADVLQQIRDINDNPPVFTNLPKSINIKEDTSVGSLVFTVSATDEDSSPANAFEFAIETGNEEGRFEFPNPADGQIKLKKSLDYDDGTKQFVLRIIAKNTLSSPYLNSTAVLTINVLDVDDLGAKFEKNLYETTLAKDSLPGTVVTTVQAKDRDSFNATVEYKIYQETNPGNVYKVNNNTGEITVNGPLTIGTQLLVVTATSTKHPPAFTVVKVNVASMLNKSYTVSVAEGQSNVVIFNLEPVERYYNITGGTFSIISSAQSSLFSIDGKNLKVGGAALDRETRDQYQLNIVVDKDGTRKGVVMIIVNVLDVNDNSPAFQGSIPYSVDIKEDAMIGDIILKVNATDSDSGNNGTVMYSITAGNEEGRFSIHNINKGEISISKLLDREKTPQYNLTIQAYDGGSPPKTNTTTVIINLLDVNDKSPSFSPRVMNVVVSERTSNDVQIAQVTATDDDIGENSRINYSIAEGNDGKFDIDQNTGAIKIIGGLSFKERSKYMLIIDAKDNGSSPRTGSAIVYITITSAGQNLHSPVLKKTDYLGGVYKDTSDDQLILTVSATDADSGANGEVIYELTENPVPFLFHLETVSGRLRSANSFVEKEGELYILKGRAKDKGSPPKNSTEANLCVFVLRDSHSLIITADVSQDFILKNDEEFRGVLDDLTGGKAFIKSVRPKGGKINSSEIIFNVVKNKTESTSDQIYESLKRREDDIKNKYSKWNIRAYESPKTGKQISTGGLSAIVGAMICLALLIGVGGIIMIIILIKKRRERERIRRNARVTFNDEPHYINIDGNMPVSRLRHAESAQEAHQGLTNNMVDETSSVGSEEVQTSPDVMNCINEAYHNEDHDGHDQEEGLSNNNNRTNFGTFFPPPPTEPPPPVPDSDADSLASEEESINYDEDDDRINFGTFMPPPPTKPPLPAPYSDTGFLASEKESINSDDDEPDYINAVLPPHEDFADNSHPHGIGEHGGDSPTHSHTGSTSQLISSSAYQDAQLHDPNFGFEALRKSSNPELSTEL